MKMLITLGLPRPRGLFVVLQLLYHTGFKSTMQQIHKHSKTTRENIKQQHSGDTIKKDCAKLLKEK